MFRKKYVKIEVLFEDSGRKKKERAFKMNKKTKKRVGMLLIILAIGMWMWDYMGTMNRQQVALDIKNVAYYNRSYTSANQEVSYAIYEYKGKMYYVSKCKVGEDAQLETKALTQKEETAFFEELNKKAAVDISTEETSGSTQESSEGSAGVCVSGTYHEILPLDEKAIGIQVKLPDEKQSDVVQEYRSQNPANTEAMEAVLQEEDLPLAMNASDLEQLVQQQLEEKYQEQMTTIRVVKQKEADFDVEAIGLSQKQYQATFTTEGCMIESKK